MRVINRDFNIEERRGTSTIHVGPMGSGKSADVVNLGEKVANHTDRNVFIAKHVFDEKAGESKIGSRNGLSIAAVTTRDAHDLYGKVREHDKEHGPQDLIIIDEAFFYGWPLLEVVGRFMHEGRAVVVSTLDKNARGEEIPSVKGLLRMEPVEIHQHPAYCQANNGRGQCAKPAHQSLKYYRDPSGTETFFFKGRKVGLNWRKGEYWSKTIDPQIDHDPREVKEGDPFYIAVCEDHFDVPGREEFEKVMAQVSSFEGGKFERSQIEETQNLDSILRFSINPEEERGIIFDEDTGLYQCTLPYHKA